MSMYRCVRKHYQSRDELSFRAEPKARESEGFNAIQYARKQAKHVFMGRFLGKSASGYFHTGFSR